MTEGADNSTPAERSIHPKKYNFHISSIPVESPVLNMESPTYNRYSTWNLIDNRGPQTIYRILLADEENLYLLKVGGMNGIKPVRLSPSKLAKDRIRMPRAEANRLYFLLRFKEVHDSFIPQEMEDGLCKPGREKKFELKKKLTSYAKDEWGDLLLQNESMYSAAIATLCIQFPVSDVSARRWIETNYFYRDHENALIDRTWEQGGFEVARPFKKQGKSASTGEIGKPPSSQRIAMKGKHKAVRLSPHLRARMKTYIFKEAKDTPDPYPWIHKRMLDECLVAYNKGPDGKPKKYKISADKLPSPETLHDIGRRIYNECVRELVTINEEIRGLGYRSSGGEANDIVRGEQLIYDLDATVADNYLLYGDDIIQIDGCSKPTVIIATERKSKAVVGVYVTFHPESSEGYLGCLISALIRKNWELDLWEAGDLNGLVFGCMSAIFVDRGAGSSNEITEKIVKELRAHSIFAQPYKPQAKAREERMMGKFQSELAKVISGSYFPSGDVDLDKVRKRYAQDGAVPVKVFMRALWEMVSKHNLSADTAMEMNPKMLEDPKFSANPKSVFEYYRARRDGDIAYDWPLESIIRKLGSEYEYAAPNGVFTLDNREFSCPSFRTYAMAHKEKTGKSYVAKVFEIPNAPFRIFWDSPFGRLIELEAKPSTRKVFTPAPKWHIVYENFRRNHARQNARVEDATNEKKKWNAKHFVSKQDQKDMKDVDKRSRKNSKDMTPEEKKASKAAGAEHLQRQQFDGLYGSMHTNTGDENSTSSEIRRPQKSSGFNNNQVLRIKR